MPFNDLVVISDLLNSWGVLLDLLILEELRSNGSTCDDVYLIMSLQSRSHLLIGYNLNDIIGGSIRVLFKVFASTFDCKFYIS